MNITLTPTMDPWDAPFHLYRSAEGRTFMARDDTQPPWDAVSHTHLPHAQVFSDGKLSDFDKARQPGDPEAERFARWMAES